MDGRIFANRDPVVYDGRPRRTSLRARLDQFEDPADVYRVRFPPRSRTRITAVPSYGDVDLAVFGGGARNTSEPGARALAASGPLARVGRDPEPRPVGSPRIRARPTSIRPRTAWTRPTRSGSGGLAERRAQLHRLHVHVLERRRAVVLAQAGRGVARDQAAVRGSARSPRRAPRPRPDSGWSEGSSCPPRAACGCSVHSSVRSSKSTPAVGSSRITSRGRCMRARASSTPPAHAARQLRACACSPSRAGRRRRSSRRARSFASSLAMPK